MPSRENRRDEADDTLIIYGIQPVAAVLRAQRAKRLFATADRGNARLWQLRQDAERANITVTITDKQRLNALSGDGNHQGVVCIASPPKTTLTALLSDRSRPLVLLDGVTDPRNLGAILRVARAFNAAAVMAPKRRSAPLSAVAAKAAAGAAADLPVLRISNVARTLKQIQEANWTIVGAAENGDIRLFAQPLPLPLCWVFGDEGGGLRRLSRQNCDILVRIPTVEGDAGCLNVATACAVCLAATATQTADFHNANTQ